MPILKKILGKIVQKFWHEKIPDFAAMMYVNLAKNAKTDFYRTVAKEIAEKVDSRDDVYNLVDIGTGPGFMLFEIAKLNPYLEMVGIDLSRKLIEIAEQEAKKYENEYWNIFFQVGDANHLTYTDNICDFVVSSGVIHSIKNPVRVIKEWLRVLKPGHDLWIYDPTVLISEEEAKNSRILKKLLKDMEKSLESWKDRLLFRIMHWISSLPPKPMSSEYVYRIIQDAGLTESVSVENRESYLKIAIVKK